MTRFRGAAGMRLPRFLLVSWVALGIWIVFQIISGLGMLGGETGGGVAYAAHIGGFLAGLILVKFFDPLKKNALER